MDAAVKPEAVPGVNFSTSSPNSIQRILPPGTLVDDIRQLDAAA